MIAAFLNHLALTSALIASAFTTWTFAGEVAFGGMQLSVKADSKIGTGNVRLVLRQGDRNHSLIIQDAPIDSLISETKDFLALPLKKGGLALIPKEATIDDIVAEKWKHLFTFHARLVPKGAETQPLGFRFGAWQNDGLKIWIPEPGADILRPITLDIKHVEAIVADSFMLRMLQVKDFKSTVVIKQMLTKKD